MGNDSLLVGCHSDGCISSYLVHPVQLSFKFLFFISLALNDRPGCGHAYLSWDNCIHPIYKSKRSCPCWSSGCHFVGPQDSRWFIYPPSFGFFEHFLQCRDQGFVCCLYLSIALRVMRCGVQIFYIQLQTKGSKGNVVELWFVISYDYLRDSESTNDILPHKLGNVFVFDVSISFYLYPFAEVVGGHEQEFFLSGRGRQGANYVHFSLPEQPRACDRIEGLIGHVRYGSIPLAPITSFGIILGALSHGRPIISL